tara:strand:+ start:2216 stop:3010 length:795 start_codon:yes stop_codon:yes gene_type:complete
MDDSNKQLLLEVISEQYRNYNIKQNNGFMGFYNNIYKYYQRNSGEYSSIQEVNKKIIQESMGFIQKSATPATNEKRVEDTGLNNMTLKQVDATDLRYVKDDKFDIKLKEREDNFQGLMNKGKPKDIDFTFKNDEDLPVESLNKLLGQTLADRENELMTITNKYNTGGIEDAAKWLKINEEEKNKGRKKLKGEGKKVSFNIEEFDTDTTVNSLLSKLKPARIENDEMVKLLNTILNKQNEILNLLKENKVKEIEKEVEKIVEHEK